MTPVTYDLIAYHFPDAFRVSSAGLESLQLVLGPNDVTGGLIEIHLWSFWVQILFPNLGIREQYFDTEWIPLGPHDSYNSWVNSIHLP
jgi:hypothetical protein